MTSSYHFDACCKNLMYRLLYKKIILPNVILVGKIFINTIPIIVKFSIFGRSWETMGIFEDPKN